MNNYLLFTCGANMYVLLTGLGVLRESVRQYFWVFPGRCFQSTWESIGGVKKKNQPSALDIGRLHLSPRVPKELALLTKWDYPSPISGQSLAHQLQG